MVTGRLGLQDEMSAFVIAGIAQAQILSYDSGEFRLDSGQGDSSDMLHRVLESVGIQIFRAHFGKNVRYGLSVEQQSFCQRAICAESEGESGRAYGNRSHGSMGLTVMAPTVSFCAVASSIPKSSLLSICSSRDWIRRFSPSESMLKKTANR